MQFSFKKLKPCPECGCSEGLRYARGRDEGKYSYGFFCATCGYDGGDHSTLKKAVSAWNKIKRKNDYKKLEWTVDKVWDKSGERFQGNEHTSNVIPGTKYRFVVVSVNDVFSEWKLSIEKIDELDKKTIGFYSSVGEAKKAADVVFEVITKTF